MDEKGKETNSELPERNAGTAGWRVSEVGRVQQVLRMNTKTVSLQQELR